MLSNLGGRTDRSLPFRPPFRNGSERLPERKYKRVGDCTIVGIILRGKFHKAEVILH